jgi:hypothetical protein
MSSCNSRFTRFSRFAKPKKVKFGKYAFTLAKETTPRQLTPEILAFCDTVSPGQVPFYVRCQRIRGALPLYCHSNVAKAIEERGGTPELGWIIWEAPGRQINSEWHCCWRNEKELVDITPQDGEKHILFLPDPVMAATWNEASVSPPNRVRYFAEPPPEIVRNILRRRNILIEV